MKKQALIQSRLLLLFLVFSFASIGHTSLNIEEPQSHIVKAHVPCFDPAEVSVINYFKGNRVMHPSGPQVTAEAMKIGETPFIKGKIVGSGANGLTYAPGISKEIYRDVFRKATRVGLNMQECPIAVLGAGIHGLYTAYEFLEQGISASHITIYAENFDHTTSHKAAGMWFLVPGSRFLDDSGKRIEEESYHAYYALAHQKDPKLKGVRELPLYTWNAHETAQELVDRGLVPGGEPVIFETQFGQRLEGVVRWPRGFFVVDPFFLMPSLKEELLKRGVNFCQRTFSDEKQFFELGAPVFIACLGSGSKTLLSEDSEKLQLSPAEIFYIPHQEGVDHMFFGKTPSGQPFGYIPKGPEQGIVVRFVPPAEGQAYDLDKDRAIFLETGWKYFGAPPQKPH